MSTQTATNTDIFRPCDTRELVRQIGTMNVLAISGGRVLHRRTGVTLPVKYGYKVTVDLLANDTYVVRRTFTRGDKTWIKNVWSGVYNSEVGDVAYRASCYLDD